MTVKQGLHRLGPQGTKAFKILPGELVLNKVPQRTPEPVIHWHFKTLFFSVDQLALKPALCQFAQRLLAFAPTYKVPRFKVVCKLNKAMI